MLNTILVGLPASFLTMALLAACAGRKVQQLPASGYACPPVQLGPNNKAGNYKTLNLSAPVSETTYTDLNSRTNPIVPGTWCYIAQTFRNGRTSPPSNTTMATVPVGKHKVVLTWNAPPNCIGCTYVLSRTAAIARHPSAPPMGSTAVENSNSPTALVK